ncbi:hypothetical protein AMJ87_08915, partial [candidate division WOR_3 bacterium SM23_60]
MVIRRYSLLTFLLPLVCGALVFDVPVHNLQYTIEVAGGYHRINLPGSFSIAEPGYPELPVTTYSYVLPYQTHCVHVDVIDAVWEEIPGEHTIYPQQLLVPMYEERGFTPPDLDVYETNRFYPVHTLAHVASGT